MLLAYRAISLKGVAARFRFHRLKLQFGNVQNRALAIWGVCIEKLYLLELFNKLFSKWLNADSIVFKA